MAEWPRLAPAFSALLLALAAAVSAPAAAQTHMDAALSAVRADAWGRAARIGRAGGPEVAAFVEWRRLRAGAAEFDAYLAFLADHSDWPGVALLRERGEPIIPADARPLDVLAYFGGTQPQTGAGAMRLSAALEALGRQAAAEAEAVRAWRDLSLSPVQQSTLLAEYGRILAPHHVARMDNLLWQDLLTEAEGMRYRVPEGYRALLTARIALRRDTPGVDALIEAVPEPLKADPGLAWARAEWRARRNRDDSLAELILARSASRESLGVPEAWSARRRYLARSFLQDGRVREAYLLAAEHHLTAGADFADLEWLAGYIALTHLDSPDAALAHFRRLRAGVRTPISLGRAGYWEGRALEAGGDAAAARIAYAFAGGYQTSFYGQLAAERAGLPMDARLTGGEVFPPPDRAGFVAGSVYRTGLLLHRADEPVLAARFFAHLAESLTRAETGQLLELTESLGDPYVQLAIAKRAAGLGRVLARGYFPLAPISVEGRPGVEPALALAIARRESEFNAGAVSGVGAIGLMQVMPATAQAMAAREGLSYSRLRLAADPAYNARLGTAYLQKLVDTFGDAPVLIAAGYNAGPGRPIDWMEENGDPRVADVEAAVAWIEAIPYRETRNYVMRVAESLAPYRARISGEVSDLRLSRDIGGG